MIDTPVGPLRLAHAAGVLYGVVFMVESRGAGWAEAAPGPMVRDFMAYFDDPRHRFTTPVATGLGTPFQQRLWRALREIPAGQVRRYGELALELGSGARAVGGGCRVNPLPLVVPCHRVLARQGMGGYAGATDGPLLEIKRWLLRHEGVRVD